MQLSDSAGTLLATQTSLATAQQQLDSTTSELSTAATELAAVRDENMTAQAVLQDQYESIAVEGNVECVSLRAQLEEQHHQGLGLRVQVDECDREIAGLRAQLGEATREGVAASARAVEAAAERDAAWGESQEAARQLADQLATAQCKQAVATAAAEATATATPTMTADRWPAQQVAANLHHHQGETSTQVGGLTEVSGTGAGVEPYRMEERQAVVYQCRDARLRSSEKMAGVVAPPLKGGTSPSMRSATGSSRRHRGWFKIHPITRISQSSILSPESLLFINFFSIPHSLVLIDYFSQTSQENDAHIVTFHSQPLYLASYESVHAKFAHIDHV